MKKSILILAMAAFTGFAFTTEKEKKSGNYKVNTSASTIEWIGTKVTGQHNGLINISESDLTIKEGKLTSGKVVIDMTSITCEDMQGEYADKLIGHLKSDDFFSVDKFKTSELVIKEVTEIKGVKEGENNYTIKGDLTIKGATHPIEFPAFITFKNDAIAAIGEMKVDRTKYDIRYGSASFFENLGDKAISNDFNVKFKLAAKK